MWVSSCTVCSALDVSNNNFASGSFPSGLTALTGLQSLNLTGTKLIGSIPSTISALSNLLSLDLHGCGLNGSIPSTLSALQQLQFLRLDLNAFVGAWSHKRCGESAFFHVFVCCHHLCNGGVSFIVSSCRLAAFHPWRAAGPTALRRVFQLAVGPTAQ